MKMAVVDQPLNELDKLLADVQRTIRENDLFVRLLKDEAVDSEATDSEVDTDGDAAADDEGYEEL
jgi:hypothetical protein